MICGRVTTFVNSYHCVVLDVFSVMVLYTIRSGTRSVKIVVMRGRGHVITQFLPYGSVTIMSGLNFGSICNFKGSVSITIVNVFGYIFAIYGTLRLPTRPYRLFTTS